MWDKIINYMIHFVNKYIHIYICIFLFNSLYCSWMIFSIMLLQNCKIYINVHAFIELSTFRGDWFWMKQCTLFHLLSRHVRIYSIYSYKIYYYNRNAIYIYSFENNLSTNIWIKLLRLFHYIRSIYLISIRIETRTGNKWFS